MMPICEETLTPYDITSTETVPQYPAMSVILPMHQCRLALQTKHGVV